jgi:hypothetical protein
MGKPAPLLFKRLARATSPSTIKGWRRRGLLLGKREYE